ncbi:MAG: M48 family metallopeptidase [Alphaproteobacteria bacterium]
MPGNNTEDQQRTIPLTLPGGERTMLRVRRSRRARRFLLHVDVSGMAELVIPRRAAFADGMAFAREKAGWIQSHLAAVPQPVPFTDGHSFPLLGEELHIRHVDQLFEDFWRRRSDLFVACARAQLPQRVESWLRAEAGRQIRTRARHKADHIGRKIARISLRDTRSQWGSCTHKGALNFSWRLVMAPEPVLDYVVAHEVAHLAELNHTRRFWDVVDGLCADVADSRAWLRCNGAGLHRYGADFGADGRSR